MELPTTWITGESLGTVAGTATVIYAFLVLMHLFKADRLTMLVLGVAFAWIPQLVITLSLPQPTMLALVIAVGNTLVTFLSAWGLYSKSISTVEKLLNGHN